MCDAKEFAINAHTGQIRRGWEEYCLHPIRVAEAVEAVGGSKDAVCAAYLHDTVEDCGVALQEVEQLFGPRVREIVDILTKRDGEKDHFQRILDSGDMDVLLIKKMDLQDNLWVREQDYWPGMEEALLRYRRNLSRLP